VTDANLLLGRIQANRFLGGEFTLDLERTRRLTTEWLKQQASHLSLEQFSAGVVRVVNANMERALRVVSIERGYDPRDFALVAFGGAGGLHACELAESLAIPTVIVPAQPGALSAFGILASDVVKDFSRTLFRRLSEKTLATLLPSEFRELEAAARLQFQQEHWTGKIQLERSLDLRYRGQGYELNVAANKDLAAAFHTEHQRRYGYHHPSREIEVVTARLRARIATVPPRAACSKRRSPARVAPVDHAKVYFGKMVTTPVYERSTIPVGARLKGPAVIAEYSATTVIPPGKRFTVDQSENVVITEP
jgi:N-methylhydantoinase A